MDLQATRFMARRNLCWAYVTVVAALKTIIQHPEKAKASRAETAGRLSEIGGYNMKRLRYSSDLPCCNRRKPRRL